MALSARDRARQEWRWSLPVRLISSKDSRRTTTCIPDFYELETNADEYDESPRGNLQDTSSTCSQQVASQSLSSQAQHQASSSKTMPEINTDKLAQKAPSSQAGQKSMAQGVGMPITEPVCVTSQQVKGVTHVVVSHDAAPVFVLENLCPFALQFGQGCDLPGINGEL